MGEFRRFMRSTRQRRQREVKSTGVWLIGLSCDVIGATDVIAIYTQLTNMKNLGKAQIGLLFHVTSNWRLDRVQIQGSHHTASMAARVVTCSFLFPSFEICKKASTP